MMGMARTRRPRLETVRRRLNRWRHRRRHARAPLPPRLWAAAVALVSEHGLFGTARALRLDYGALKAPVEATGEQARVASGFVALPAPLALPSESCVMEIAGAGTTVRVRLHGLALPVLAAFARLVVGADA